MRLISIKLQPNEVTCKLCVKHDDVIKWKHFPCHWSFVWGIRRSPANSPHKGQWRGALMFSLICAWINGWVNNREAGDLRRHRARYDVIVMNCEMYYTFSDCSYNIYLSLYTQLARCKDIVNKTAPIISTQHMPFLNRPSTRPTPIGTRLVHNGKSDFIAPSDRDQTLTDMTLHHGVVIKWNHFPSYRPFVWGIHLPTVNSCHKGQWRGALAVFSLICAWTNGCVNNRDAGDLRRHRAHYEVTDTTSMIALFIKRDVAFTSYRTYELIIQIL